MTPASSRHQHLLIARSVLALAFALASGTVAQDVPGFLRTHCGKCHGAQRSKGGVTVHDLPSGVTAGLERWERVLEVLEDGVMPPPGQKQPTAAERARIVERIDADLRAAIRRGGRTAPATTRRLTNFEYHNTVRDLVGFELRATVPTG